MATASFRSDRSWSFPIGPDDLWERIVATDEYRTWWPWLRQFDGGGGLASGERWTCVVAPPLPYTVRFHIDFDAVEPTRLVESTVSGDIAGTARLTIEPETDGSLARLVSSLHPTNPLLRGVGVVARPLVEFGHNWILDEGRRQFVDRAVE